jgi:hypothetical protein
MHLVQILLPVTQGDTAGRDARFRATRAELVAKYEGVTAYVRSPAQGLWTAPDGRVERDEMMMVEVLVETFDRAWWREYADTLAARFEQQEIHIRALVAEAVCRGAEPWNSA